jgi:hypothetical protein
MTQSVLPSRTQGKTRRRFRRLVVGDRARFGLYRRCGVALSLPSPSSQERRRLIDLQGLFAQSRQRCRSKACYRARISDLTSRRTEKWCVLTDFFCSPFSSNKTDKLGFLDPSGAQYHWLTILATELVLRLKDAREQQPGLWVRLPFPSLPFLDLD